MSTKIALGIDVGGSGIKGAPVDRGHPGPGKQRSHSFHG